jgi:hypothetical protein
MIRRHRRSALEAYDGCPHRFQILYELCRHCGHRQSMHRTDGCHGDTGTDRCMCQGFENIEDRGDESQRGIGFHEAAFRYTDRLAAKKLAADAEEASLAFREGVALTQLPARLVNQVKRLWGPFVEWFQLDLDAYFAAEEQQLSMFCLNCGWRGPEADLKETGSGSSPMDPVIQSCPECEGPVSGFTWIPDLVYVRPNEIEITDYKTYYKGLTEAQMKNEFQVKFYLWQAMNLWPGFNRYTFTMNFVRLRYAVSVTMTHEEIEAFSDEVKGIALAIYEAQRTQHYPAIPGSHCGLCRLKCPVADNPHRLPVRITRLEERDAAAARILVLENELKTAKRVLKAWCEVEGGFVYHGEVFAFWPEVERQYPADEVLTWMKDRKIDVSGVQVSQSGLGKEANTKRASNALLEFLDKVAITKQGWTFRHRKVGEEAPEGTRDLLGDEGNGD